MAPSDDAVFWKLPPWPPLTGQAFGHSPPRPPLTRGLATELTGGEKVSFFPETFGVFELFSLPPSKIFDFCHLPHQREAWVSAFLYAGGTLVRGRLGFLLSSTPVELSSEGAQAGMRDTRRGIPKGKQNLAAFPGGKRVKGKFSLLWKRKCVIIKRVM